MLIMNEIKKLIKAVKVNLNEDEFEFLSNLAKTKGDVPISRLARSIILDFMNGTKSDLDVIHHMDSPETDLNKLIERVSKLEFDNNELLSWKKEMEEFQAILNSKLPFDIEEHKRYKKVDFSKLETGLEEIDEIMDKFKKQNPPKKELYVPDGFKNDEDIKDKV
ncbi:MAG: hypothetical protein COB02_18250 [Candidatus Cloacimonadota bacterium]|nr:MAG: hypothetical protein COB02_18250 [Candidatus Cloacimonadota bacterium]